MTHPIRPLLDRLCRLSETGVWGRGLNPSQAAALGYLAQANRFSRAPSQVAEYLGATRGTVSQTLKALARKGLIQERPDPGDRRRVGYEPTSSGRAALGLGDDLDRLLSGMSDDEAAAIEGALRGLLGGMLAVRGGRTFGLCRTCRHHARREGTPHCALLDVPLAPGEEEQICHEHAA